MHEPRNASSCVMLRCVSKRWCDTVDTVDTPWRCLALNRFPRLASMLNQYVHFSLILSCHLPTAAEGRADPKQPPRMRNWDDFIFTAELRYDEHLHVCTGSLVIFG